MDAKTYVTQRQQLWARQHNISFDSNGWVTTCEANLYEPLCADALSELGSGAGNELEGKMRALHSSSALCCNVFHYWKRQGLEQVVLEACGLGDIPWQGATLQFEQIFLVAGIRGQAPHLDVAIRSGAPTNHVVAVESKFREPYDSNHSEVMQQQYLNTPALWKCLPGLKNLADQIAAGQHGYAHLGVAQLVKHLLGLTSACPRHGTDGRFDGFTFLYLWYDVPLDEGKRHHDEIDRFRRIAVGDGIDFREIRYQELILKLLESRTNTLVTYVDYLAERYL